MDKLGKNTMQVSLEDSLDVYRVCRYQQFYLVFCTICTSINIVKRANNILLLDKKKVLTSQTSWAISESTRNQWTTLWKLQPCKNWNKDIFLRSTVKEPWDWAAVLAHLLIFICHFCLFFFFVITPHGSQNLSSSNKDWTCALGSESRILTTGKYSSFVIFGDTCQTRLEIFCISLESCGGSVDLTEVRKYWFLGNLFARKIKKLSYFYLKCFVP